MKRRGQIWVVAGKGGVGKTSVSAILAILLAKEKVRLLLIDADPMVNMAYALGEPPWRTIGDYRESVIENKSERRRLIALPMKAVIREMVRSSNRGYDLLAMGRAEGKGCFCGVNELLRYGIQALSGEYDMTLIDCEAGVEQVNRRAVHRIDKLVLVTDTSRRGMETLVHVKDIAVKYNEGHPLIDYVVVNRIRNEEDRELAGSFAGELGFRNVGFVPEDDNILEYNSRGQPLIDLPYDSPSVPALRGIQQELEYLHTLHAL